MKTKLACIVLALALAATPQAAPISFNEVSLLVRMHEKETYIAQQLAQRHLLRMLTPDQEAKLKEQGAPESLLQTLRNPATILAPAAATAFESWSAEQRKITEERVAQQNAELAAIEAARNSTAATWSEPREGAPAPAEATTDSALPPLSDTVPYGYGAYGYGGYGAYGRTRGSALPWTNRSSNRASGSGSLQWNNGTATTHTGAGLTYYPLGTNGAGHPTATTAPAPHATAAHAVTVTPSSSANTGHTSSSSSSADSGHTGSGHSGR